MQARALSYTGITFMWNAVVEDVLGDHEVEALELRHVHTGGFSVLPV
jgi:hypothetical protein